MVQFGKRIGHWFLFFGTYFVKLGRNQELLNKSVQFGKFCRILISSFDTISLEMFKWKSLVRLFKKQYNLD